MHYVQDLHAELLKGVSHSGISINPDDVGTSGVQIIEVQLYYSKSQHSLSSKLAAQTGSILICVFGLPP